MNFTGPRASTFILSLCSWIAMASGQSVSKPEQPPASHGATPAAAQPASGTVVATDLETDFLESEASGRPCLEVLRHDIMADALPTGFDLVHARWLVEWLPDKRLALERMAAALRGSRLVGAGGSRSSRGAVPARRDADRRASLGGRRRGDSAGALRARDRSGAARGQRECGIQAGSAETGTRQSAAFSN